MNIDSNELFLHVWVRAARERIVPHGAGGAVTKWRYAVHLKLNINPGPGSIIHYLSEDVTLAKQMRFGGLGGRRLIEQQPTTRCPHSHGSWDRSRSEGWSWRCVVAGKLSLPPKEPPQPRHSLLMLISARKHSGAFNSCWFTLRHAGDVGGERKGKHGRVSGVTPMNYAGAAPTERRRRRGTVALYPKYRTA